MAMANTLAAAVAPVRNVHPSDPLHQHNWIITTTEPVPDGAHIRIGQPPHSEPVHVATCTGSGPYLVRLRNRIAKPHAAGEPITVLWTDEADDARRTQGA
jgi:hypothetical protein